MSRISNIITKVRRTLGDSAAQRWSDEDMLAYLNEALEDICIEALILRDDIAFYLVQDIHTYTLPEDTIEVLRTDFYGEPLQLFTYQMLDMKGINVPGDFNSYRSDSSNWQTATTTDRISFGIFSKLKRRQLRVWPKPTGDLFSESSELGTFYTPAGADDSGDFDYAELADVENLRVVVVKRAHIHPEITDIETQFIMIDTICDKAIRSYMIACAFEDDIKETNRAISDRNYNKYYKEIEKIQGFVSDDSMPSESFETQYNAMG